MMGRLASQDTGVGYVWSPHFLKCFVQVQFSMFKTFDSFATPEPGTKLVEPSARASVDLNALSEAMAETIERTKATDPKLLTKRIRELEVELASRPAEVEVREVEIVKEIRTEVPVPYIPEVVKEFIADLARVEEAIGNVGRKLANVMENVGTDPGVTKVTEEVRDSPRVSAPTTTYKEPRAQAVTTPRPSPKASGPAPEVEFGSDSAPARMAGVLVQFPDGVARSKLAMLSKTKERKSTFGNAITSLRKADFFEERGGQFYPTQRAVDYVGDDYTPLPTGPELLAFWLGEVGSGSSPGRMLSALHSAHPQMLDAQDLGGRAGVDWTKSTFGNALTVLRKLGILRDQDKMYGLIEDFFA
jgi:hypothetical protein